MEALVRDGVVPEDYTRSEGAIGYRWCDARGTGGLLIETETHPMTGKVAVVLFSGCKDALELAHAALNTQGVQRATTEYK